MNAQEIAKSVVLVFLWVIALGAVCALLIGCESLSAHEQRTGGFTVETDCDGNEVRVEFNLDQGEGDQRIKVTR